ncbi:MAG: hypothetical protein AVDCRST_MAG57-3336, partial [uncultured Blastococcus sp.]
GGLQPRPCRSDDDGARDGCDRVPGRVRRRRRGRRRAGRVLHGRERRDRRRGPLRRRPRRRGRAVLPLPRRVPPWSAGGHRPAERRNPDQPHRQRRAAAGRAARQRQGQRRPAGERRHREWRRRHGRRQL